VRAYRPDDRALAILLTIVFASFIYRPVCALVAWLRRSEVVSEAVSVLESQ